MQFFILLALSLVVTFSNQAHAKPKYAVQALITQLASDTGNHASVLQGWRDLRVGLADLKNGTHQAVSCRSSISALLDRVAADLPSIPQTSYGATPVRTYTEVETRSFPDLVAYKLGQPVREVFAQTNEAIQNFVKDCTATEAESVLWHLGPITDFQRMVFANHFENTDFLKASVAYLGLALQIAENPTGNLAVEGGLELADLPVAEATAALNAVTAAYRLRLDGLRLLLHERSLCTNLPVEYRMGLNLFKENRPMAEFGRILSGNFSTTIAQRAGAPEAEALRASQARLDAELALLDDMSEGEKRVAYSVMIDTQRDLIRVLNRGAGISFSACEYSLVNDFVSDATFELGDAYDVKDKQDRNMQTFVRLIAPRRGD